MEIITSSENKLVKKLNKLKQKKYRDEYKEFFVEGYKNVLDSVRARPQSVKTVILSEKALFRATEFDMFDTAVLCDPLFDKVCDTDNSQGVMSVHAIPKAVFPENPVIFLDRVRDPGNVGTILRTALAAGYDVVLDNCADVFSPKVVRSAMSAVLKCRIAFDLGIPELKNAGYEIVCSDMGGGNVFTADKPRGKYCIVIGNEADGISADIRKNADRILSVPQSAEIESLNAAVAAGIMMYALNEL